MCSSVVRSRTMLAAALAAALLVVSCDAFSLRDSEQPTGSSTQLIPATQPLAVRGNVWRSINNGDAISYGTQLSEDFTFVPDPMDEAQVEQIYPGAFDDWTLAVEEAVIGYILDAARCDLSILGFSDSTVVEETEDLYTIQYAYSAIFILDTELQTYAGEARLLMRKESADNLWYLYKWEDIRMEGSDNDTWGVLRGRIRCNYVRGVATMRRRVVLAVMTVSLAVAGAGCWNPFSPDDDNNGNHKIGDRTTPNNLLEFFATAYEDRSIERYDEALDFDYKFEFMEADYDSAGVPPNAPYWGKTEDVPRTQNMFESPNTTGISFDFGLPLFVNWVSVKDTIFVEGLPVEVDALLGRYEPDIEVVVEGEEGSTTYWVNNSWVNIKVIQDRQDPSLWTILRIVEMEKGS